MGPLNSEIQSTVTAAVSYDGGISVITTACRGQSSLTLTYPTPDSGLTYTYTVTNYTLSAEKKIIRIVPDLLCSKSDQSRILPDFNGKSDRSRSRSRIFQHSYNLA